MKSPLASWSVVLAIALSASAVAKMPSNSFLVDPAWKPGDLQRQLTKHPVVADRYMRHFAMTRTEVKSYLASLRLAKLPTRGTYTIYNVPPKTGTLRSRLFDLDKGTYVWVDYSNRPVLLRVCGNPMTRGPKAPTALNPVAQLVAPIVDSDSLVLDAPEPIPSDSETLAMAPKEPTEPDAAETVALVPDMPTCQASLSPVPNAAGPTPGSPLDALSILPGLGALSAGTGSAAMFLPGLGLLVPPVIDSFNRPGREPAPPVPEPGTLVVVGLGLAALARRRVAKR